MPQPGHIYRHYKGAHYMVLHVATEVAETGESSKKVVVYQDIAAPEKIWVRDADIFTGELDHEGQTIKRFERAA